MSAPAASARPSEIIPLDQVRKSQAATVSQRVANAEITITNQDTLLLDVRAEQGPHMETLAFYFPIVEGKDAVLRLHWGTVMVPLSIRVP